MEWQIQPSLHLMVWCTYHEVKMNFEPLDILKLGPRYSTEYANSWNMQYQPVLRPAVHGFFFSEQQLWSPPTCTSSLLPFSLDFFLSFFDFFFSCLLGVSFLSSSLSTESLLRWKVTKPNIKWYLNTCFIACHSNWLTTWCSFLGARIKQWLTLCA